MVAAGETPASQIKLYGVSPKLGGYLFESPPDESSAYSDLAFVRHRRVLTLILPKPVYCGSFESRNRQRAPALQGLEREALPAKVRPPLC